MIIQRRIDRLAYLIRVLSVKSMSLRTKIASIFVLSAVGKMMVFSLKIPIMMAEQTLYL